ncbi:MAG: acyl-[acyl-carrier-protein]--UDP-N-acetylglucosamine O-acyltransferase [Nitrospinae bacterium CG11_big_fil_rev_8_21_14_0_20_56_8]|nr:MAG: acyl-[acyl-carrier-protein]--UDP-N-acetylglucosamine O-acyltransferase [Nitrospinae bacterium CG11_big_fil_rev_8_21_14_0_20_56_8]
MTLHASAEIHPTAQLGENVTVGPFTSIGSGVRIGAGTHIGSCIQIGPRTVIGNNCRIGHGAAIGGDPQILGFNLEIPSYVEIGDRTTLREYVTVNRSGKENQKTRVGNDCLLMAYVHVAHDCQIGNNVVIVNYTGLSGHILVEDRAFISGMVGMHQFIRIGKNAMVGGMAGLNQDVLPFSLVEGHPARLVGINAVGLKRSGFAPNVRSALKKAVSLLKQPDLNTGQAIGQIEAEIENLEEIRYLVNFIRESERGITK